VQVLIRIGGGLVVAHGLVHLLYFVPAPEDADYKFSLDSWLVPASVREPLAIALVALTIVSFALLGLALWGVSGVHGAWPQLAVAGAVASLVLLLAFWDVRLLFGVVVDLVLIFVATTRPPWSDAVGA
jgi:hypothetical protein